MIQAGGGYFSQEVGRQTLYCSYCGKHLGNRGWDGDKEFNEVEENGGEYCPYCGEPLYE